jgi:hypothetical protein
VAWSHSARFSLHAPRQRQRGEIETLPSGSLRVRVYAGLDPITGKRNYLTEVIAPGSAAAKDAEKARPRAAEVIKDPMERHERTAQDLGIARVPDPYLFSLGPDRSTPMRPGLATELISAGVDPRTVAGRLGHGSGGATTLRVYAAWVSEACGGHAVRADAVDTMFDLRGAGHWWGLEHRTGWGVTSTLVMTRSGDDFEVGDEAVGQAEPIPEIYDVAGEVAF